MTPGLRWVSESVFSRNGIAFSGWPLLEVKNTSATFDLDKDHLTIASLDGLWRFHFGDDTDFAKPDYDDSSWRAVRSDQSWARHELLPSGSASFWYPTKVLVPADSPPLSLYVPYVETNYQLWVDGRLIGGIGGLPPHPMLAVLIFRFTRTRLHEESYERKREAARTVQRVLVPEEAPATPGFVIHSVYKPYDEVGGDFFQIIPIESGTCSGSVLVAIGDVSGKGMPAAMTLISLLVGTFRSLAHFTQGPTEILAAMNQRMLARSNDGFTTCLVLRADADGKLTIANAGHISRYLAGIELSLNNGLPLGLDADTTYAESTFQLPASEQLTLVTDGVAEARDKAGTLYGFERTAVLSLQPAETIAQAA